MIVEEARRLLEAADVFFDLDDEDDAENWRQVLNLNDSFYWACSDGEQVSDEELPRVADLFFRYGMNGIYYWVLIEKRNTFPVKFHDVNRGVEFVRCEEQLRKEIPNQAQLAYTKHTYTLGSYQ